MPRRCPEFIVCDEPVSALDVSIQAQILNLLKELQRELGLTLLFVGHGLGAVNYVSDQIAVMYLGKIVEYGRAKEIFNNPVHPYTKALLEAVPIPDTQEKKKQRRLLQGEIGSSTNPPAGCRFHTRCPYAQEKCKREVPVLEDIDGGQSWMQEQGPKLQKVQEIEAQERAPQSERGEKGSRVDTGRGVKHMVACPAVLSGMREAIHG